MHNVHTNTTRTPLQGDVVLFASKALEQMAADGMNVVLEGRAATVQVCEKCHTNPKQGEAHT